MWQRGTRLSRSFTSATIKWNCPTTLLPTPSRAKEINCGINANSRIANKVGLKLECLVSFCRSAEKKLGLVRSLSSRELNTSALRSFTQDWETLKKRHIIYNVYVVLLDTSYFYNILFFLNLLNSFFQKSKWFEDMYTQNMAWLTFNP